MNEPLLSIGRAACMALGVVALMIAAPEASSAQTELADAEVPFLTQRNRTEGDDPGDLFGDERSGLSAGYCRVQELEIPVLPLLADAVPSFLREEFLRVESVTLSDASSIYDALEASAAAPAIYVHGYYIGFEKGCRRALLFRDNANLNGRFLWFSWPSDGAIARYTHDVSDLYWSVPDMADAIIELDHRFGGGGEVDVAGHSLGARGVVLALYEVANRRPETRLGDIVLLAPDMDFGIFQRMLPRILPIAENITVYVTTGDRPLALSAQLHGYPRLGEAGNDTEALSGVEVIDLSELPSDGPTGHLYHLYRKEVGEDLDQLLNDGLRAAERRNVFRTNANTWSLRQADDESADR